MLSSALASSWMAVMAYCVSSPALRSRRTSPDGAAEDTDIGQTLDNIIGMPFFLFRRFPWSGRYVLSQYSRTDA